LKPLQTNELKRLEKLTELESAARAKGYQRVVGIDEAGRGPLAGPVVAVACHIPCNTFFPGINDSKLLLPNKRKVIYEQLIQHKGVYYGIGIVDHSRIDEINIFQAALEAMRLAVGHLPMLPDCLLIDGDHPCTKEIYSETIVKGDSRSQMIAAASIIAKETRDKIMQDYHALYPQYGFDEHKGYATQKHRRALAEFGPCPIHRRSFSWGIVEEYSVIANMQQ
jgi:ribonuclease HII